MPTKLQKLKDLPGVVILPMEGEWSVVKRPSSTIDTVYWHLMCGCGAVHFQYETEMRKRTTCKNCEKTIPDYILGFLVICRATTA